MCNIRGRELTHIPKVLALSCSIASSGAVVFGCGLRQASPEALH